MSLKKRIKLQKTLVFPELYSQYFFLFYRYLLCSAYEQLTDFTELSLYIDAALKECKSFNKVTKNESLAYSVINAGENLSMIEFILEDLLEQVKLKLDHYDSL